MGRPRTIKPRIDRRTGCWLWPKKSVNSSGYGPHRRFYEEAKGPVPEGLVLDHTCKVKRCVNPDHLEPVTQRENLLRHWPTCEAGHPWTEENTYIHNGHRMCRACRARHARDFRERRRHGLGPTT